MPPTPAPAAPAAPAPAPAPVAPKPAGPAPMDRQDSHDSEWLAEAGSELEQLDRDTNQPRPPRPAQGPPKPKADAPPAPKPQEQVQPAQDDEVINPGDEIPTPKQEDQPAPGGEPERPMKAPELRKAYETSKKRIQEELEPEVTRLRARVAELEQSGPKDTEQTQARVKHLEERNNKLEEFVRLKHYEQSEEYQEKYQKPHEEAWRKCLRDINQLEVEVQGKDGQYVTRKATDADVTYLAQLASTNLSEYYKVSNAMFGDAAEVVRKHVDKINETWEAQTKAIEEATKRSGELSKNEQAQLSEQQKVKQRLWEDNNAELATKFPTFFAQVQGDDSGNKLLNSGFAFADLLFSPSNLTPDKLALLPQRFRQEIETKGRLSPELAVRAHAIIRNKAANHDRLARSLKSVRAELEETKKKLSEYEQSEPSAGGDVPKGGTARAHWRDEYDQELEDLARRGPS